MEKIRMCAVEQHMTSLVRVSTVIIYIRLLDYRPIVCVRNTKPLLKYIKKKKIRTFLYDLQQTTGIPGDKQTSRRQKLDVFSSMVRKAISTLWCQIWENSEIFENQILHSASTS
jgi:hypothetical protein